MADALWIVLPQKIFIQRHLFPKAQVLSSQERARPPANGWNLVRPWDFRNSLNKDLFDLFHRCSHGISWRSRPSSTQAPHVDSGDFCWHMLARDTPATTIYLYLNMGVSRNFARSPLSIWEKWGSPDHILAVPHFFAASGSRSWDFGIPMKQREILWDVRHLPTGAGFRNHPRYVWWILQVYHIWFFGGSNRRWWLTASLKRRRYNQEIGSLQKTNSDLRTNVRYSIEMETCNPWKMHSVF